MGKSLKMLKLEALKAQITEQRAFWSEIYANTHANSLPSPVCVFNQRLLWFGCCLFLPHQMLTESHRFIPILSCSVEQIFGEERKLHHVETSETMTSSYRYHLFFSDFKHTETCSITATLRQNLSFVVGLHRNLPLLWSSGPPSPPIASPLLILQRSRWWDAVLLGVSFWLFLGWNFPSSSSSPLHLVVSVFCHLLWNSASCCCWPLTLPYTFRWL